MSAGELQIHSEKEENSVNSEEVPQALEEIVPSSSPEGGFPNEVVEEHLVDVGLEQQIEEANHGEIVETGPVEELVENPGNMQNDVDQMLSEQLLNDQNSILVTQEDVYAAGIQVDNLEMLTDEQVGIILSFMEQRKQNMQVVETEIIDEGGDGHDLLEQDIIHEQLIPDDNSITFIITEDGGLKIADHTQQEFHFSPEQLQNLNINVNNLTEDDVQQLLLSIPSISIRDNLQSKSIEGDVSVYNEEVINQMPSTSYDSHENHRSSLIGETVHVKLDNGKIESAIVRYLRGDSEYKIQLINGKFMYATIDQLILPRRLQCDNSYQPNEQMSRCPPVNRHKRQNTPLEDNEEMPPPLLKRSYHFAPPVDGPHVHHAPNFCCPICDRKVYQKEPSYIVIRLPACDSCTREKIIVLDEPNT